MDMIWKYDDSIDDKRVASARYLHGVAQSFDAINKQGGSTIEKIDREEPASSGDECPTVIWHQCTLAIFSEGNNGGLRLR
jgi:hypothetical protein